MKQGPFPEGIRNVWLVNQTTKKKVDCKIHYVNFFGEFENGPVGVNSSYVYVEGHINGKLVPGKFEIVIQSVEGTSVFRGASIHNVDGYVAFFSCRRGELI